MIIYRTSGFFFRRRRLRPVIAFLALAFFTTLYGQTEQGPTDSLYLVEGTVLDANTKAPLEAVQIRALNYLAAATTDENGAFSIEVGSSNEVLLVYAYDYNTREIPVQGKQQLVIELYPDVFTDFYKDIERISGSVRSTYAVNALREIDDMGQPSKISVDEVIQAELGGDVRTLSGSGAPGNSSRMFIRGLNSLNLNAQPLIVVDGVVWNSYHDLVSLHNGNFINVLADIDVNDIESVTVNRDGASMYGSKGGNGVILINTKRGEDIATKITVNAVGGVVEQPGILPMMNGDQFRLYITDLLGSAEFPGIQINELGYLQDDPSRLDYKTYHNITNWADEVYQQGNMQSYNISVNGGDDKALYAFSIGYTGSKGVVKSTDLQRLNTRFNADFVMTDKINMGLNVGFTNVDRYLLDDGVQFYTSPAYLAMIKAPFLNPYSYTASGTLTTEVVDSDDFNVGNPTAIIEKALNTNKHYRLNLGAKPSLQLTPSLSLSSQLDYSLDGLKVTYYSPIIGVADRYVTGLGLSENVFRSQQMRNITFFDETRLQYILRSESKHRLDAIAGWRYVTDNFELDYAEGHNSGSDQKRNLLNEEDFRSTSGEHNRIKSISNFFNADYSYDNRYFVTASVAVDGSSRFGRETIGGFQLFDHSWGVFPALRAGWLLSSEEFMANATFIDRLKIRGGLGQTGNDVLDPYAWSPYFISTRYMDRANGLVIGNIGNTEIQWETSTKISGGVDANLFNDRLALTADIYSNRVSNLLTLQSLPLIAGNGFYWNNGGEMSNKGFEIYANAKLLNLELLKWELGASLGRYKNRIESLPDGDIITSAYGAEILTSVGHPAGAFYGYKTKGVYTSEADVAAAPLVRIDSTGTPHAFGAGDMHFVDVAEDGIIDENDKQIIGDPNPDLYGSFNSKISVWDITVEAFFTFSYGNDIYNYLRSELESGSGFMNQTTAMLNRWYYEGQETSQPHVVYNDPMGNARFSDRWIEDGSYLRLKSLSVSYRLPVNNSVIDGMDIWIAARNLWTLTNYLGRDPEVSAHHSVLFQGIDTGLTPVTRSYFIGIKMNL